MSIRYADRLNEVGIAPSVGRVGDSYDNALAETINGLYKTRVIRQQGPWRNIEEVEFLGRWVQPPPQVDWIIGTEVLNSYTFAWRSPSSHRSSRHRKANDGLLSQSNDGPMAFSDYGWETTLYFTFMRLSPAPVTQASEILSNLFWWLRRFTLVKTPVQVLFGSGIKLTSSAPVRQKESEAESSRIRI